MENMKTIKIKGIDFKYDANLHYLKDGHVYCNKCNEQIEGQLMESPIFSMISRRNCECDRKRIEEEKEFHRISMLHILTDECFHTVPKLKYTRFNDNTDPNTKEYKVAKKYVEKFELMQKENIGLLFHGNVGSGKTHLASCIANEIIQRYNTRVKFRNIPQIINDIEKGGFKLDKNEYIHSFCRTPLLILDDFGIERKTDYSLELLYQIINARYESRMPTIISTNVSINTLNDENVELQLRRIYSRIMEMCTPIAITGDDRRLEKNRKKTEIARRELLE